MSISIQSKRNSMTEIDCLNLLFQAILKINNGYLNISSNQR